MKRIIIELNDLEYLKLLEKTTTASVETPEQLIRQFLMDLCCEVELNSNAQCKRIEEWFLEAFISYPHANAFTLADYFQEYGYDTESAIEMMENEESLSEAYQEYQDTRLRVNQHVCDVLTKEAFEQLVKQMAREGQG